MEGLKNIIVTGSNKGIGYGIVQNLAGKPGWNIIMACRNTELATKSQKQLLEKFPQAKIQVEQLDVSKTESIKAFAELVKNKYKEIDVLVNNAGIAAKGDAFDSDIVKWTFATNFYGTMELTQALLPYIAKNGKVIIVGSTAGLVNRIQNEELVKKLMSDDITKQELIQILQIFQKGVAENNFAQKGFPKSIYGTSKIGINVYPRILSKYPQVVQKKIQCYSLCPGYVDTDMTSHKGPLTIQQGAETPVYLIELPFEVNPEFQGRFFSNCKLKSLV